MARNQMSIKTHGYMSTTLDPYALEGKIVKAVELLKNENCRFDAVAFRGISGAMLGPPIAVAMKKSMILIRKPNDGSHAQQQAYGDTITPNFEGDTNVRRYIIVDDFQDSGSTARAIVEEVNKVLPKAVCIGVCEVNTGRLRPVKEPRKPKEEEKSATV